MTGCAVPNCPKPHDAKGYCTTHYWRWKTYGDPLTLSPRRVALDLPMLAAQYAAGCSIGYLAGRVPISASTLRKRLGEYGVTIRGRGRPRAARETDAP